MHVATLHVASGGCLMRARALTFVVLSGLLGEVAIASTAGAATTRAKKDPCALLDPGEVGAAYGGTATEGTVDNLGNGLKSCTFNVTYYVGELMVQTITVVTIGPLGDIEISKAEFVRSYFAGTKSTKLKGLKKAVGAYSSTPVTSPGAGEQVDLKAYMVKGKQTIQVEMFSVQEASAGTAITTLAKSAVA